MASVVQTPTAAKAKKTAPAFVDCDVHNYFPSKDALFRYLPAKWQEHHEVAKGTHDNLASVVHSARHGGRTIGAIYHSRPQRGTFRWDAQPPGGGLPGSDFDFLVQDYLDLWPVTHAILAPLEGNSWPQHGEYGAALCAALNDWNAAEWMARDRRLYGAIVVPSEDAILAAAEVRRSARNARYVQVFLPSRTRDPLGHTRYWPLYEAAQEVGLPIALHVGGYGNAISAAGWGSYHFEYHASFYHSFQSQVVSLIASGVFERYPDLQFVMEEGGFLWAAPLAWRLDRAWKHLGIGQTRVLEAPSETLRKHFSYTTQPMDEAETPQHLLKAMQHLDELGLADRVMFATDYPHWDFDAPDEAILPVLPQGLRDRIFRQNALALYRFGASAS